MFKFLDKYGLPVKYAVIGFFGGVIWLIIASLIQFQSAAGPLATLAAVTIGGFAGGFIRQRMGKSK